VVKGAICKAEGQTKRITLVKVKSQHFALGKSGTLERRVGNTRKAQVTSQKGTVNKLESLEIEVGEIAVRERTVLVFTFGQGF
jgi:hypothetical protein